MSIRPRARVHLSSIAGNWRAIAALNPGSDVAAVVKADAYGHGADEVGRALFEAGCRHFYVAYGFEGAALRRVVGPEPDIYIFNGLPGDEAELAADFALIPVINTTAALVEWQAIGGGRPYGLHLDTGMNRLGLRPEHVSEAAALCRTQPPALILSHLACADEAPWQMNERQRAQFTDLSAHFPDVPRSLSNTGGSFLGGQYSAEQIRPGIGLYGGGPKPPGGTLIQAGLTLEAVILSLQHVRAGETVGYGATYTLPSPASLATVALGYGDGFPRSAGNRGFAVVGGERCAIVGRVSMDLITLDVSAVEGVAKPGALAQFIGPDVPLEEQAALAGTVGYELTTGLGHRVERIYEA